MICYMYRVLICMFYLSLSTTIIEVDRAIVNVRNLFPKINIKCILVRVCPWRLVIPLRQRGGQPILLWRRHLRWLWQRPSGLHQHLRHSLLSPHPPKMDSIASPPTPVSADGPTPAIGRRWGDQYNNDGEEEVVEVRWTTTTRPSRRREGAAGKRAGSRSPQGGRRMGAVTMKSAKTCGGNCDGGGNVVSQKQAVGQL
jgi:hypothetical protein